MFCKIWNAFKVNYYPLKTMQISKKCSSCSKNVKKSSLLISGKRAENTFVVVIPHLEFESRFNNINELEENIKRRGLNFNLGEMKESWEFYKEWNEKKNKLQQNLSEAGKKIKELSSLKKSADDEIALEKFERYRNIVKEELHKVKENVWSMEDDIISEFLNLPNYIHKEAPIKEVDLVISNVENIVGGCNHLDLGNKLNILEYHNKLTYFLKNEAAIFELAVPEFFLDHFILEGFIRFSNPDFSRSVLAEGVGVAPGNTSELFLLENTESNNDHLHLCGGASIFPFCGYHAKHTVPKQSLPLKYITTGRNYSPMSSSLPGLYSTCQSTSVQFFCATSTDEELNNEFQHCLRIVSEIFTNLGLSFKLVKQPPQVYKNWESLRVSIQSYSPYKKVFVEVGSVSVIDEFISKRLRMCYSHKNEEPFLKVISGTAVNVQTLLALCLERSENSLFIPNLVKPYINKFTD